MVKMLAGAAVIVATSLLAYEWFSPSADEKILADIEQLSQSGRLGEFLTAHDLMCFSINTNVARIEFSRLLQGSRPALSKSLAACGSDGSCCNIVSDVSGVIGLVKGDQIRCVAVNNFDYWAKERDEPVCVEPAQLRAIPITSSPGLLPGRPGFNPKRPSFEIGGSGN